LDIEPGTPFDLKLFTALLGLGGVLTLYFSLRK